MEEGEQTTTVRTGLGRTAELSRAQRLAVQVCSGLMNRARAQSVYVVPSVCLPSRETGWFVDLYGDVPAPKRGAPRGLPRGVEGRAYAEDQRYLPQIVTMAGVLDLVPFEEVPPGWLRRNHSYRGDTAAEATLRAFGELGNRTSIIIVFKNPGYRLHGDTPLRPPLLPVENEDYAFAHGPARLLAPAHRGPRAPAGRHGHDARPSRDRGAACGRRRRG